MSSVGWPERDWCPTDLVSGYTPPSVGGATATTYTYDDDGQIDLITLPTGQIDVVFNNLGQLTTAQRVGSSLEKKVLAYDAATGDVATLKGPKWTTSTTAEQTLTRSFDGPFLAAETSSGIVAGIVSFDRAAALFNVSRETVTIGANAYAADYLYDQDGLLTQADPLAIKRDAATGSIAYTCLGSTGACDATPSAGEILETRTYDAFGALASLTFVRDAVTLFTASYIRDELGRILTKTESLCGTTSPCTPTSATYAYSYDPAGRLTDVDKDSVNVEHYVYDVRGNRTSATNSAGTRAAVYDNQDRITSFGGGSVTNNLSGEVTARATTGATLSLARNIFGDLSSASANGGATQTYSVDALGRRGQDKSGTTVQAQYLWRGALAPVAQLTSTGLLGKRFIYATNANVPDVVTAGATTYRLIKDHLGSVRLVVRLSDGAVLRRLDFDAYGRKLATSAGTMDIVPFGFAGGFWDPDTGLLHFGARDYDPETGRWLSKDPSRFGGRTNFYEYAAGDPVNYVDITGRNPIAAGAAAAGGGVSGILAAGGLAIGAGVGVACSLNEGCRDAVADAAGAIADICIEALQSAGDIIDVGPVPPMASEGSGEKERCRRAKDACIEMCSEEALPTGTLDGAPFKRCMRVCMDMAGCP